VPHFFKYWRAKGACDEQVKTCVACLLAFVAGGVNVVGFLSTEWFASHLSGAVTGASAALFASQRELAIGYATLIFSFVCGSACAAWLIAWSQARNMRSEYAIALMAEGCLLLGLGIGAEQAAHVQFMFVPALITALSFLMGMQNALISKLAHASVRTTHVTGMLTDFGIELGRLGKRLMMPRRPLEVTHAASLSRLGLLALMAILFFAGGLAGSLGFQHARYMTLEPLAAMLLLLAWASTGRRTSGLVSLQQR
jgi:uncharacterized membrane protein YoaK (UPF0700 family)